MKKGESAMSSVRVPMMYKRHLLESRIIWLQVEIDRSETDSDMFSRDNLVIAGLLLAYFALSTLFVSHFAGVL